MKIKIGGFHHAPMRLNGPNMQDFMRRTSPVTMEGQESFAEEGMEKNLVQYQVIGQHPDEMNHNKIHGWL